MSNAPLLHHVIPRTTDIGNLEVKRAVPSKQCRSVGPFVFWDQFGPGELLADQGIDVRPHPHIGLATLTYLFDGHIQHRDSLGSDLIIGPGAVNLMTAGSGIVHSERSDAVSRAAVSRLFGIQSWLALPRPFEEQDPDFIHYADATIPEFDEHGIAGRVVMGQWAGLTSPVAFPHPSVYVDLKLDPGGALEVPAEFTERAIFSVDQSIELDGILYQGSELLVLAPGYAAQLRAPQGARVLIFGGEPLDGPRHLWWNFVASDPERLEQAKRDWVEGRFATVPGETEWIPLPEH
jgi:redox-sensitive bicupin YhaK (pirin superfamily)